MLRAAPMEYIPCNFCGRDSARPVAIQNGFTIVQCTGCSLVYVNPRPPADALLHSYAAYHQRQGKNEQTWKALMRRIFNEMVRLLDERFPYGGSLLDIGCGYGYFIELMRAKGWRTVGIDPSPTTVAAARARGLTVHETSLDSFSAAGSFDAITAFYVLEHLTDPRGALEKIFALLKPGGLLVVRVPHTTPLVRLLSLLGIRNNLYDAPFHLYDFSPATLRLLLETAGFEDVTVTPGLPTLPTALGERVISVAGGSAARLLYRLSRGALLLPGTSKTALAAKPLRPEGG